MGDAIRLRLERIEQKLDSLLAGRTAEQSCAQPSVGCAKHSSLPCLGGCAAEAEGPEGTLRGPWAWESPSSEPPKASGLRAAAWSAMPNQPEEPTSPETKAEEVRQRTTDPDEAEARRSNYATKQRISGMSLAKDVSRIDRAIHLLGLSGLWSGFWTSVEDAIAKTERKPAYRFVKSPKFQVAVCGVILLQGMLIGYGASNAFDVQAYGGSPTVWADYFEICFVIFFMLELALRIFVERIAFLLGSEWRWNIFDSILVLMSMSDLATNGSESGSFGGAAVGRILRLSRFFALMRLSRVMRQLPSLRIILLSILDSMTSLVWCFLFIAFIQYVFAVLVVYGAADHLRNNVEESVEVELKLWWGGIYRSMVTLFMTISGGCDWGDVVVPLRQMSAMYEPLFLFYIFFMCFGVLNVVVGAFVATTQQIAANDPESAAKYAVGQMENYLHRINGFFKQADVDHTGTLSWEEFKKQLEDPKTQSYFQALELDVSQAPVLFDLLDADGSGAVTVEEFVEGCVRLRGQARSIDVNKVMCMCERTFARLEKFMGACMQRPEL